VTKRIMFVQAGNYAEAYKRFQVGGEENFYAQRYSVDYVAALTERADVSEVVQVCLTEDLEEEVLPNGIRQLGLNHWSAGAPARTDDLIALVLAEAPTHLISNSPITAMIRATRKAGIDILPLLADSFRTSSLKARLLFRWLAHNLSHRDIRWVSNHNTEASFDLQRIGVPAKKIVPFDWPALVKPEDFQVKTDAPCPEAPALLYVGQVKHQKGVGDLIDAVAIAAKTAQPYHLTVIGSGDVEAFEAYAKEKGVARHVNFAGKMAHGEVLKCMHKSDVVLVPSHHEYPEGLPMTIYEGLCSRTPLVVSDHPMFSARLKDGRDCVMFPAKNAVALVEAINRLVNTPALYKSLSRDAAKTCDNFLICAPFGELVDHWLGSTPADDAWLAGHALSADKWASDTK
jgi:glycosyltransferase involved in cell wall biosynthesis